MKNLRLLFAIFIIFAIASCGTMNNKYTADYDDIYYSNEEPEKVTAKNNKPVNKEEVIMKAYSRSDAKSGYYAGKESSQGNDSLAGELDDQVVYIDSEENMYSNNPYTSSNVYRYLQSNEQSAYETSYEDRINKFSNNNTDSRFYSNFHYRNWSNSFYPTVSLMFGRFPYYNPYVHFGYYSPYYVGGYGNAFYSYNPVLYNPYSYYGTYGDNYNMYNHYRYYGNYYKKHNLQRTRRQRVYNNPSNGSASRYGSYHRRNATNSGNFKSASNLGNKRNVAQRQSSQHNHKYENKTGHRRSSATNRTTKSTAYNNYSRRRSSSSYKSSSSSSSYSSFGTSRSRSRNSGSSSYSRPSRSSSSSVRSSRTGRRR